MSKSAKNRSTNITSVKKGGRTASGQNRYIAKDSVSGKFIAINSRAKSTEVVERLTSKHKQMLLSLADR